jgi:hypothetical protein
MVSPYRGATRGIDDDFNYYHSQLRITIERAFGMLVQRFGILRKAMPQHIPILKKMSIVMACMKIHNFLMPSDGIPHRMSDALGEVDTSDESLFDENGNPKGLLDGGEHFDDVTENDMIAFGQEYSKRIRMRRRVFELGARRPSSSFNHRITTH